MPIHVSMSQDKAKNAVSHKALEFVKDSMIIGLGTGSTAAYFIKHLIERYKSGLKIKAVATSTDSEKMAKSGGIPILNINVLTEIDLTVDGADEVDPQKRLIKGAGGALVREKIIANMSKEMIVIIDETKIVDKLGKHPLPIELVPFGIEATKKQLEDLGFPGQWRRKKNGDLYTTDNGNYILDLTLPHPFETPELAESQILRLPGVIETGFFFNLAHRVLIGKEDGSVQMQI